MWMRHPVYCDDVVVRGIRFVSADPEGQPFAEGEGPNSDGIDIDSSRNVRISDCFFDTSDDCIVIKSGRDHDGLRTNRPTEFVTITNCVMFQGHGAGVIGSETSGGIRNITARNCVSVGTDCGIRIKFMRGRGGVLGNFRFDHWVIEDAKKQAFEINTRYHPSRDAPFGKTTPVFKNFSYSNITIKNAAQIATIVGLPEKAIEELRFTDINTTGKIGFIVDQATDVELHHVRLAATSGSPISIENSSNLVLDDVSPRAAKLTTPAIAVTHSTDLVIRNSRAAADTGSFPFLTGAKTAGLVLTASDLTRAQTDVEFGKDASPQSVTRK